MVILPGIIYACGGSITSVKAVSMASSVPGGGNPGAYSQIQNVKGVMQIANLDLYFVDFEYLKQFDIKMAAGQNVFPLSFMTDTTQSMILNESAAKCLDIARHRML